MTDCCLHDPSFYGDQTSALSVAMNVAYEYNASTQLPVAITLPLTPAVVKQILDDRSVVKVNIPAHVREAFYTLAYVRTDASPNLAADSGCISPSLMVETGRCQQLSMQQCVHGFVELLVGRISATCSYNVTTGACERSAWYRHCPSLLTLS